MSYLPIAKTLPQYVDTNGDPYSGAVLKAYAAGTSTNISFATDNTGITTASSVALNASGYPEVSGSQIIPHIDQDFKLSLYPTQAAADSDSGAIWTIDNIAFNLEVDLANNKIINLANGTDRTDAINVGQVQDSQFISLGTTAGSADAYTLTPSPAITAYATPQFFIVEFHAANATTTPYLQISGIGTPASDAVIKKLNSARAEVALEAGDIPINTIGFIKRNSANDAWILQNPEKPYLDGSNITQQATTSIKGFSYLQNIITCVNGSDTEHDITFSGGVWNFDDGSGQAVATSYTKQIDNPWSAGDDAGGLDTGTVAADTWYYGFAIYDPTNDLSDFLISASPTSPSMPTNYTKKRRIKGVFFKTNSSSNIIQFFQAGNTHIFAGTTSAEGNLVSATSQTGSAGTLSGAFPAITCKATMNLGLSLTATGFSSFTVWGGNLQPTPTGGNPSAAGGFRASTISTNNNFEVSGTAIAICDNGQLKYQNFDSAGGVDSIEVDLISIEDLTPDY